MSDPTPERWAIIQAVFDAVVDLPAADRPAALDATCRDRQLDGALRAEIQALLDADALASGLDQSAPERAAELVVGSEASAAGTAFGAWQVEREIGRGGMGAVYLVSRADGAYTQRAALKRLTHAGARHAERFRQERQILARLEHPGIARLIDGGVTPPAPGHPEGMPYLVMEHVEGTPITRYADDRQLDVTARANLFVQVCDALAYAHRHLVVHRDVKPSNVFVAEEEGQPRVKLLDFGVAKLLEADPAADLTQTGLAHLTPEYAAPEQVDGGAITAETDVYALGVVLYELLAGQRPYEIPRPTLSSIVQVVCHTRPAAPSAVAVGDRPRALRGDLDTIVMKALEKEPERRYVSALELGADLRRYLNGHPVVARAPTPAYRARRFVGRHRTLFAVGLLALLIASSAVLVSARRVVAERDLARQAAADAEAVSEVQSELLEVLNPAVRVELDTAATPVDAVVDRTIDKVERAFEENPAVLARSLATLGATLFHQGELLRADSLFTRALELRRPLGREGDAVVYQSLMGRGLVARAQENDAAARGFFRGALEIERAHPDVVGLDAWESTELFLASVLDDADEREQLLLRTLAERRAAHPDTSIPVAQAHNELAVHYFGLGNYRAAFPEFRAAERIVRSQFGELNPTVVVMQSNIAYSLSRLGRLEDAERTVRRGLDAARRGNLGRLRIGNLEDLLAQIRYYQGDYADAERLMRSARALIEAEHGAGAPATFSEARSHVVLLGHLGRTADALAEAEALGAAVRRAGETPGPGDQARMAGLLYAAGRRGEAWERMGAARAALGASPSRLSRAYVLHLEGAMHHAEGRAQDAEPLLREALELQREAYPEDHHEVIQIRFAYGRVLADLGQMDAARPHLEAARNRIPRVGFPESIDDVHAEIDRLLGP